MKHQSADITEKWRPALNRVQIIGWASERESLNVVSVGLFAKA